MAQNANDKDDLKITDDKAAHPRPCACCDESEGHTVEERRTWAGERTAPYPAGQRETWTSLTRYSRETDAGKDR